MQSKTIKNNKSSYFGLARCPYCESKVPYTSSFFSRDKGEYTCKYCGETSNIFFKKKMNIAVILIFIIPVIIFAIYLFAGDKSSLTGVELVFAPFIIFFLTIPFFFRLSPMEEKKRPASKNISSNSSKREISSRSDKTQRIYSSKNITIAETRKPEVKKYGDYRTDYPEYEKKVQPQRKVRTENTSSRRIYDDAEVKRYNSKEREYSRRERETEADDVKVYSPKKKPVRKPEAAPREKAYTLEQRRAMSQRQVKSQESRRRTSSGSYSRLDMDDFDEFD